MGIIKILNELKAKKNTELARKREKIRQAIINFYEKENSGTVELPAFVLANNLMKYYCRTEEQINYYYDVIMKAGA